MKEVKRDGKGKKTETWNNSAKKIHALLLDIDHTPGHWLNPGNGRFYTAEGLQNMAEKILPGGIFGLWSNDLPDKKFSSLLDSVFGYSEAHVVSFPNPFLRKDSHNTVYIARTRVG